MLKNLSKEELDIILKSLGISFEPKIAEVTRPKNRKMVLTERPDGILYYKEGLI
jgi:hypothetical protein